MQIFCLFFCALCVIHCELGGKITQSMQVCLSKTSRPLNKLIFYIRLTALRRGGYSFSPTLRFATHWAELTRPCGAVTVASYQPTVKTIQHLNNSTPQRPKGITFHYYFDYFAPFFTFLSLLNQLLRVRLSVFDHAHEVQSCRQSGHRDLECRLIRPERAQHRHTAPELDFVSASVGREHA